MKLLQRIMADAKIVKPKGAQRSKYSVQMIIKVLFYLAQC